MPSAPHQDGGRGGASVALAGGGGGMGGGIRPTHGLNCHRSEGAKGGARGGAVKHACRSVIAHGPAAPWSGGRRRSLALGGAPGGGGGGGGGGVGGGGDPPAADGRGGIGRRAGGGRPCSHPSARVRLPGDPVQEVLVKARVDAAEDVRPPGCGPDLPRLRQDGPRDIGYPRKEGVHRGRHLQRGCRGLGAGGGGGLAGGLIVPHPAPPVHRHGVGPDGGRLSHEEGDAAERADVPSGVGVVRAHHLAVPGWPRQRRGGLLLAHWR